MIVNSYDQIFKKYRCYDDKSDWVAFSGFGNTREEAENDYFSIKISNHKKSIASNPTA